MHKIILHITNTSKADPSIVIGGEELYAEELSENTARIITMPFNAAYCWGDIVEHNNGEIVKVLERKYKTYRYSHRGDDFSVVENYFKKYNIVAEVLIGSFFGIAVPDYIDEEELNNIIENSDILLNTKID